MKNKATIMMVTYNRVDLTKKTIDEIIKNTNFPFEMVVVDNGSSDETISYLESLKENILPSLYLHQNNDNKGIAIGRNQAMLHAVENFDSKWLVTLDNDVLLPKNWLTECVNILSTNRNFGAIGVNMEGINYKLITKNKYTFQEKSAGNLGTACMVFPLSIYKLIGYFNTEYEFYAHEDADFGFRIRMLGLKMGYIQEMGEHLGEGAQDRGKYRDFKNKWHKKNLAKFNQNCRAYITKQKSLYIPFEDEKIV